ncbi:MAG TPA: rhodanese-like domain-containing protein, partial [Candidatus Binatia bacterium]
MEIPQIQIHDAKNRLDQKECVFVDIRDPGSYREAHIPGAIHLHDGNVQEFLQNTAKDEVIVVYCYHGNSSLGATAFLLENGFKDVASMSGG